MDIPSEFNRVTFGLPVESFRVQAHIALEERLPVVTECVETPAYLRPSIVINFSRLFRIFGQRSACCSRVSV